VSIAFGGWQWCYYGLFAWWVTGRSGFLILFHSNCLGAVLGTYYTFTFYKHCKDKAIVASMKTYLSAVATLVLFQACVVLVLPVERALFLTGLVASFCSFVGALSMLVSIPMAVRTGSSQHISGPLVLAYFLSSVVWCLCGYMLADPMIAAPNVVAMCSSGACLYCKAHLGSRAAQRDLEGMALKSMRHKGKQQDCEEYSTFCKAPEPFFSDDTGGTC